MVHALRPERPRLMTALVIAITLFLGATPAAPAASAGTQYCFQATRRCTDQRFYDYWLSHGGLAQQGYPISDIMDEVSPTNGQSYQVQYFERARFEYHPGQSDPRFEVLLGLLGLEQLRAKYPAGAPRGSSGDICFQEVQRCTDQRFYAYWLSYGGLAQQGYPISDIFDEVNPTNGISYRVQYFERARFEYHPDVTDPRFQVLLGLLGNEQLAPSPPPPAPGPKLDAEEATFLRQLNAYRGANGLGPLALSAPLNAAADWMSNDMAAKNYFAHTDSLGRDPFRRMCDFGYCANTYKGENLAAGNAGGDATFLQWKNSPGHNANMLNRDFRVIGIARAPGGQYGWYWTTDFGGE